jgi:ATP-dependent protease ClpP protease subunit
MSKRKNLCTVSIMNKKKKLYFGDNSEESDDESDVGKDSVWRDGNNIFFYADVKESSVAKLNKYLFEINRDNQYAFSLPFKNKLSCDTNYPPIYLHIKSDGGCVESALSSIDLIKTSLSPVYTIIEGYAASAATMISIVGQKRFIHKNAHMLIHQMSAGFWGKMVEIKDEIKNISEFEKVIFQIYKEHADIPDKKFNKILKHDLWWSSKKCLKYNLVDEII